jgi:hypothetical protein
MKKIFLLLVIVISYSGIYAQNDSIYFWKSGVLLEMRSIKTVDLDSITFRRPASLVPTYPAGSVFCASGPTAIIDVTNPTTGKTWMDRNLGASRAATSSTDASSYGDLYQRGRRADGHQCRNSGTTSTLSSTDQPTNGNFILSPTNPYNWLSQPSTNLWQGVNGLNNPCPSGYRLPTETELIEELTSWIINNSLGAFASPLKLTMAGSRYMTDGNVELFGIEGWYWSSTANANFLFFNSSLATVYNDYPGMGGTVRCLRD